MGKGVGYILLFGLLFSGLFAVASTNRADFTQQTGRRVLMVVSSYGKDSGKERPGYAFDEFSQAYLLFRSNNLDITIASPKGGAVVADEFNEAMPYNQAVLQDKEAMATLANTRPTATIDADSLDALFIVGGKGAMFDLPHDPALQDLIASLYQTGKVVSAVGRGPAAFVHVTLDNGQYLVDDKAVSGFTNEEEALFGRHWKDEFPFLLENKLIDRGAFIERADLMLPQISTAGKLITGQNQYSALGVAEAVVRFLGKQPIERDPYLDERSMALLKKMVAGQKEWAIATLRSDTDLFDMELIALYGYYRLLSATDSRKVQLAIDIIELATPYLYTPTLQLARAEGYLRLGDNATAKRLLVDLIAKEPDHEEARALLESL